MNSLPMQGAPLIDTEAQQLEGSEAGERVKEKQQISLSPLEYTLAFGCECVSICVCVSLSWVPVLLSCPGAMEPAPCPYPS